MSAATIVQRRTPHGTITDRRFGDTAGRAHITARSQRHADRLVVALRWFTYYHGPGRGFAYIAFNAHRKRLEMTYGLDV